MRIYYTLCERNRSGRWTTTNRSIVVSPAVFDALRKADLLVQDQPVTISPTWGTTVDDDGNVLCTLIEGERIVCSMTPA